MSNRRYVMAHGKRIEIETLDFDPPAGKTRKNKGAEFAVVELDWIADRKGSHRPARKIEISGQVIELPPHPMFWASMFACPKCDRNCYRLYQVADVWACRQYHGLDYSSRHRNRSIPGLARSLLLRRWIGAEPRPFAPLPERPRGRNGRKHVAEIARIEEGLVSHLREVNNDLRRRIRTRKAKGQW